VVEVYAQCELERIEQEELPVFLDEEEARMLEKLSETASRAWESGESDSMSRLLGIIRLLLTNLSTEDQAAITAQVDSLPARARKGRTQRDQFRAEFTGIFWRKQAQLFQVLLLEETLRRLCEDQGVDWEERRPTGGRPKLTLIDFMKSEQT